MTRMYPVQFKRYNPSLDSAISIKDLSRTTAGLHNH